MAPSGKSQGSVEGMSRAGPWCSFGEEWGARQRGLEGQGLVRRGGVLGDGCRIGVVDQERAKCWGTSKKEMDPKEVTGIAGHGQEVNQASGVGHWTVTKRNSQARGRRLSCFLLIGSSGGGPCQCVGQ